MIELLIGMVIVGLLASIAMPQYAEYRQSAFNAAARGEMESMRADLEGHFIASGFICPRPANILSALTFKPSEKVYIFYGNVDGNQLEYEACAYHELGDKYCAISSKEPTIRQSNCTGGVCTSCNTHSGTESERLTSVGEPPTRGPGPGVPSWVPGCATSAEKGG